MGVKLLVKYRSFREYDGSYPPDWERRRKAVLKRDNYRCRECGAKNRKLHVHHIVPISDGGSHDLRNLITLCQSCHNSRHPVKYYLKKSIKERKTILMTYENKDSYTSKKKINPYKLLFYRNMQLLVGWDIDRGEVRYFRPKRVKYVDVTSKTFSKPPNFDSMTYLKKNFRIPGKLSPPPNAIQNKVPSRYHSSESKKCFIATASYGTPHAEEIDILREFRDKILKKRKIGKWWVDLYYKCSPPIAKLISESEVLKSLVRECFLSPIVKIMKKIDFKNYSG